jgi:hypothetical protein
MRKTWFSIFTFALFLLSPALSQAATKIDDPAKFVKGVYAQLAAVTPTKTYTEPDHFYTPHLASLWALEKKEGGDGVGRIDFDFWVNGQDWALTGINVTQQAVEFVDGRKVVIVKFKNFNKPQEIHFYFEKSAAGWKLDDVRSVVGENWTLSLILKYGWDSGI